MLVVVATGSAAMMVAEGADSEDSEKLAACWELGVGVEVVVTVVVVDSQEDSRAVETSMAEVAVGVDAVAVGHSGDSEKLGPLLVVEEQQQRLNLDLVVVVVLVEVGAAWVAAMEEERLVQLEPGLWL